MISNEFKKRYYTEPKIHYIVTVLYNVMVDNDISKQDIELCKEFAFKLYDDYFIERRR